MKPSEISWFCLLVLTASVILGPVGAAEADARSCDGNWPTARGDIQRTGACGRVQGPGTGEILWSIPTQGLNVAGSPAIDGDTVYFQANEFVYAVNRYDGSVRWTYETGGGISSSPAVVDGTLFIGSGDGHLYALDATNGTLEWRHRTGTSVHSPPSVKDGRVIVGLRSDAVLALDAATGAKLWNATADGRFKTSPILWKDRVFTGAQVGKFHALDVKDGSVIWTVDVGSRGVRHSAALDGGTLYVPTAQGDLFVLDPWTGEIQALHEGIVAFGGSVAIAGEGRMYIAGDDGQLLALDPETGAIAWNRSWDEEALRPVAIGPGTVYTSGAGGTVWALNSSTGAIVWQTETSSYSRSPPTLADGVLYIGSNMFQFFAIDAGIGGEQIDDPGPQRRPDDDRSSEVEPNPSSGLSFVVALSLAGLAARLGGREG